MTPFLTLLAKTLSKPLFEKLENYLEIQKGALQDKEFEKFYRTLVMAFLHGQKGLDAVQAGKFFASPVTYDGVLAWLYNFTDPDREIRDKYQTALCRHADYYKITGKAKFTNEYFVALFINELERELRRDANKSLLPLFADVRQDIRKEGKKTRQVVRDEGEKIGGKIDASTEEIKEIFTDLPRQIAEEIEARAQRVTQIDDAGEHITVAGRKVYDATEKVDQ